MLDLKEVLKKLPHAFPFQMIDRIVEIEPGKRAIALKNVSHDETFLQGHFPTEPMMPWVFIVEALAQTGGIAFHSSLEKEEEEIPILARIDEFRVRGKVIPGDQIVLQAEVLQTFSHLAKVKVAAKVEEKIVADGIFVLAKGPFTPPSPLGERESLSAGRQRGGVKEFE
jgi:3-hydroxyacyl-[acyl-carrier-protein] dehydratase